MKNNTFRKIMALVLVWCLMIGGIPSVAFSEGTDAAAISTPAIPAPMTATSVWISPDRVERSRMGQVFDQMDFIAISPSFHAVVFQTSQGCPWDFGKLRPCKDNTALRLSEQDTAP